MGALKVFTTSRNPTKITGISLGGVRGGEDVKSTGVKTTAVDR